MLENTQVEKCIHYESCQDCKRLFDHLRSVKDTNDEQYVRKSIRWHHERVHGEVNAKF